MTSKVIKVITTKDIGLCWHDITDTPKASPGLELRYDGHLWQRYLPKGTVLEAEEIKYGTVRLVPPMEGLSVLFEGEYEFLNPNKKESNDV